MGSLPRGIAQAAVALVALSVVILLGGIWPLQLLDPAWQLRVGSQLINSAPLALMGLALLHLASSIDPGDSLLQGRRSRASALAVAAVLGFLLLIPLLSTASVRQQQLQSRRQEQQLQRAEDQLREFRGALKESTTPEELERRLVALRGPRFDPRDRSLTMPLLRQRVGTLLDSLSAQIQRQRTVSAVDPVSLTLGILRTALACLTLAIGFAALARRSRARVSLLEEVQIAFANMRQRLRFRRQSLRSGGPDRNPDAQYIRQISDPGDQPPQA